MHDWKLKILKFINSTFIMHLNYHHLLVRFLCYIISCLSIILIIENYSGLPFCLNLSTIFKDI